MKKINKESLREATSEMKIFLGVGYNEILYDPTTGNFKCLQWYEENVPHEWPKAKYPWEVVVISTGPLTPVQVLEIMNKY